MRKKLQTSITADSLVIYKGSDRVSAQVPCQRMGKVKTYIEDAIIAECWKSVDDLFLANKDTASDIVYYGAVVPPEDAKLLITSQTTAWNSVFFVSRKKLRFASYTEKGEILFQEVEPMSPQKAWGKTTQSMNAAVGYWAAPPVNNCFRWANLVRVPAAKVTERGATYYCTEDGEFAVAYSDEVEADVEVEVQMEKLFGETAEMESNEREPEGVAAQVFDDEF